MNNTTDAPIGAETGYPSYPFQTLSTCHSQQETRKLLNQGFLLAKLKSSLH